jgi:glutathione S-transferase
MDEVLERLRRGRRTGDAICGSGRGWLLGARSTLADVVVVPVIVRMADIGLAPCGPTGLPWPAGSAWMRADPAFATTYCQGSLLTC